jgi:hypothetical protein
VAGRGASEEIRREKTGRRDKESSSAVDTKGGGQSDCVMPLLKAHQNKVKSA